MARGTNQHRLAAIVVGLAFSASAVFPACAAAPPDELMRQWTRSCALCHVDGTGGAPRVGDAEAWQARVAQGRETLLEHTVTGFNRMPPLGYCMSCGRDDLRALIDFMTGDVTADAPEAAP